MGIITHKYPLYSRASISGFPDFRGPTLGSGYIRAYLSPDSREEIQKSPWDAQKVYKWHFSCQLGDKKCHRSHLFLLGQWLNFKLFGITFLVGKISRSNFCIQAPGRLSEFYGNQKQPLIGMPKFPRTSGCQNCWDPNVPSIEFGSNSCRHRKRTDRLTKRPLKGSEVGRVIWDPFYTSGKFFGW